MRLLTHRRHASLVLGLSLMAAASVIACRDITSLAQENPGALSGSTLYVPGNAELIVNGAISDFECAYARYVVGSGLFADELSVGISQTANFDYDARRLLTNATYGTNNCGAAPSATQQPGIYTPLSTARATTDTAAANLEKWTDAEVPNRAKLLGQSYAYAGYSLVLLGESMCTAAINLGPRFRPRSSSRKQRLASTRRSRRRRPPTTPRRSISRELDGRGRNSIWAAQRISRRRRPTQHSYRRRSS